MKTCSFQKILNVDDVGIGSEKGQKSISRMLLQKAVLLLCQQTHLQFSRELHTIAQSLNFYARQRAGEKKQSVSALCWHGIEVAQKLHIARLCVREMHTITSFRSITTTNIGVIRENETTKTVRNIHDLSQQIHRSKTKLEKEKNR